MTTTQLGLATVLVSITVGLVAYSQMRIASAKVKLDLYNKRFAIYVAALDFYIALWHDPDSLSRLSPVLTRAFRESQFLFSGSDGIYETLRKIQQHGIKAKYHHEQITKIEAARGQEGSAAAQREKRDVELSAYEVELKELERRISKYLAFANVAGWTLTDLLDRKSASNAETR
ncbi:UNVERIFIED_ORG: hypothetical protein M2420_000378 [Stenotrophomonas maltophilia]|uniref:hypothetical protein n=1 Tax=Stenotrophomonas indicatrix TaxID=2045451 RepID=UPI000B45229E